MDFFKFKKTPGVIFRIKINYNTKRFVFQKEEKQAAQKSGNLESMFPLQENGCVLY